MNPILLIIDMQQDFFEKEILRNYQAELVDHINALASEFRTRKIPVVWVRQIMKADLSDSPKHVKKSGKGVVLEGTAGAELIAGLAKKKGDYEIVKKRYSAFFRTALEDLLSKLSIDTLIIAGINTHACIRMSAIDAYERDYDVIIASECVYSWDKTHHEVTLQYLQPDIASVLTNKEIIERMSDR